ncbi:MAG: peptidyl-prolyl cis-trans isomerase [Planctomycetes bacterium]|nr:peptidyl-prolyl cis-trans isomerase [Planctomycetota bacterium]
MLTRQVWAGEAGPNLALKSASPKGAADFIRRLSCFQRLTCVLIALVPIRTGEAESAGSEVIASQNQVVAIVNSEVITMLDVLQTMPVRPQGVDDEEWLKIRFQVFKDRLKGLIERKLLYQEAKLAQIELLPDEMDEAVEQRWQRSFGQKKDFLEYLKGMNMTLGDFQEQVKEDLMARAIIQRRIQFDNSVSTKELVSYYEEHLSDFTMNEKRKLSIIQVPVKLESGEEGEALARSLVKRLRQNPVEFAALARTHSIGPGAAAGGDWGWQQPSGMLDALRETAFRLAVGQVSDVIATRAGCFILKVEASVDGRVQPFEEAQATIRQKLQSQRFAEHRTKLIEDLTLRGYVVPFLPNPDMLR